jgi:hypothetical protein
MDLCKKKGGRESERKREEEEKSWAPKNKNLRKWGRRAGDNLKSKKKERGGREGTCINVCE